MHLDPPLDHESLLTLARKAEASADEQDPVRLERAVLKLFEALVEHVGAEQPDLMRLSPGESRLLRRGQQRTIDLLVDLAVSAQHPGPCRCSALAEALLAQLTLQADDERLAGVAPQPLLPHPA